MKAIKIGTYHPMGVSIRYSGNRVQERKHPVRSVLAVWNLNEFKWQARIKLSRWTGYGCGPALLGGVAFCSVRKLCKALEQQEPRFRSVRRELVKGAAE